MLASILIIIVFAIMAALMMTRRLAALLALPFMAIIIGIIVACFSNLPLNAQEGESFYHFIFETIFTLGPVRLSSAMMYAIFGSMLSQVVLKTGIAENIVKIAAELAGDRKIVIAIFLAIASAVVFTSLTGLGAVILIGTLVVPILVGTGIPPVVAGGILLFSISLGGMFNAAMWGFYQDALKLDLAVVKQFVFSYGILLFVAMLVFIIIEILIKKQRFAWSVSIPVSAKKIPKIALLTPIIPVFLIMLPWTKWPIIPAFVVGIFYGLLTTEPKKAIQNMAAAVIEGIKDMAPVIGLFMGIGMVLVAVMDPLTSEIMKPLITAIVPHTKIGYFLFFGLLAPLALYRGPLNLYGLGCGFAALLLGTGMPSVAVMAAFIATGQIQGICDPTNTHNVWIAQFSKTTPEDLMKKTIIYIWAYVFIALLYFIIFKSQGVLS